MQLTYTGRLFDASGEICFLTNLPAHTLLNGGAGSNPLSVNEIFTYSPHKSRLSPHTQEVKFRPHGHSSTFRDENDFLFDIGDLPSGGVPTSISPVADVIAPVMIGFAWRGVFPGNIFSLDVLKNIEWRAEPSTGIAQSVQHSSGASKVPAVTAILDQHPKHAWTGPADVISSAARSLSSVMGGLQQSALGFAGRAVQAGVGQVGRAIENEARAVLPGAALGFAEDMLPFFLL